VNPQLTDSTSGRKLLLPDVDEALTAPFWAAAREHRLVVQRCDQCGALRWPPLPGCPECLSRRTTWVDVATTGTLWSYAVYHRALSAFFPDVPYTVAVVDLDAGPRMTARLVGSRGDVAIGARVHAEFTEVAPRIVLPHWSLSDDVDPKRRDALT
jgi:uncharacterized protein